METKHFKKEILELIRKNLYEILDSMEFDVYKEYEILMQLFQHENIKHNGRWYTVDEYINISYFRNLKIRGTEISLYDFMEKLKLDEFSGDLDELFILCEFLIAILPKEQLKKCSSLEDIAQIIFENIDVILEKTNHKLVNISETEEKMIIVENNKAMTLATEIVDDMAIAFDILEYNHFALKGKLDRKKKILTSIGLYIEPILKSKVLQKAGYKQLESDAGFIFNNFHIRHNNKEGAKAQEYIIGLTDEKLEEWYDKAYDTAIAVIILSEHLNVELEIAELKGKYKWKM